MKKFLFTGLAILLNIFIVQGTSFQALAAPEEPWTIDHFHSDISINEDSSIDITERIEVDFFEARRGIFRDIPLQYKDRFGQPYNLRFNLIAVTDEVGNRYDYEQYSEGPFKRIRIGNPGIHLMGKHIYTISYRVERAYTKQQTDLGSVLEFPWNVTGTWAETTIQKTTATVHFPTSVAIEDVRTICFTGVSGSTNQDCFMTPRDDTSLDFTLLSSLPGGEQFTLSLQIPQSQITPITQTQELVWYLADNYMILYAVFLVLLITTLWYIYGRDYPVGSIVPQWKTSENMSPLLAKMLTHEIVTARDLPAAIIFLATRGYIRITGGKKEFGFERINTEKTLPTAAEKKLLESIFMSKNVTTTSQLKNTFYTKIPLITNLAASESVERKWFYSNPNDVRALYIIAGVIAVGCGIFASVFAEQGWGVLASCAAGIVWFILSLAMPKMTRLGKKEHSNILGLREYIARAEVLRLKVKNPAGHTKKAFDDLLPYAMVFGLEKQWVKQFEDVLSEPSAWLQSNNDILTAHAFNSLLSSFGTTSVRAFVSAPASTTSSSSFSSYSSSGGSSFSGGSSGGGFGGGGGGSW